MTIVSKQTYIDINKGKACPNKDCQSTEIVGGGVNIDGIYATQAVTCSDCDTEWEDTYTLSSFEVSEGLTE